MPFFRSPVTNVQVGKPHDLWWAVWPKSTTLVKHNGSWRWVYVPNPDFVAECEVVLRGGYVNPISDSLAAELVSEGFGEYITES